MIFSVTPAIKEKVWETENLESKEFSLLYRTVARKNARSSKLRVVYDTSIQSESGYSLNYCLEKGPSFQNKLLDFPIRSRF